MLKRLRQWLRRKPQGLYLDPQTCFCEYAVLGGAVHERGDHVLRDCVIMTRASFLDAGRREAMAATVADVTGYLDRVRNN